MKPPTIDEYRFGRIVIDGVSYNKDVLIFPDRVQPNWWRVEGHALSIEDLGEVFNLKPAILVIGTGAVNRMRVPTETEQALEAAGIRIEALTSKEACARYNELKDQENTVAGIHLTC